MPAPGARRSSGTLPELEAFWNGERNKYWPEVDAERFAGKARGQLRNLLPDVGISDMERIMSFAVRKWGSLRAHTSLAFLDSQPSIGQFLGAFRQLHSFWVHEICHRKTLRDELRRQLHERAECGRLRAQPINRRGIQRLREAREEIARRQLEYETKRSSGLAERRAQRWRNLLSSLGRFRRGAPMDPLS